MSGDLSCSIFVQLPRPQKLKNSLRRFFCYKNYNTIRKKIWLFLKKIIMRKNILWQRFASHTLFPHPFRLSKGSFCVSKIPHESHTFWGIFLINFIMNTIPKIEKLSEFGWTKNSSNRGGFWRYQSAKPHTKSGFWYSVVRVKYQKNRGQRNFSQKQKTRRR